MHSISEVGTNVPAFLAKLWKLVEDPTTNGLITWSSEGSSFLIRNQAQFSRELLPLYYKHNNLASFIRQLNMYGFRKISSVDSGGLKLDKDEMEFAHKYFLRGHPYLLDNIKRKIPTGAVHNTSSMTNSATGNVKPELVSRVLQDVRQMKGRQENLDSRFNAMKRENEALWRELALLRQKHMKQQQIVNKLIQFLVTLVQPNRGLGIKRTYPLMLNDSPNVLSNSRRGAPQPKAAKLNLISDLMTTEELSPKGPVIHELDNNVEYILPDDNYEDLGGVEFDCGKTATEKAKVGVAAGATKLKSGVGYSQPGPVSPEVGTEGGVVPLELAKELDRVVPLVNSPSSSLGNLDSLPSSPANNMGVATGNLVENILVSDPDPQSNMPESCLLPSVEYPLSPEMFMGSVDPAVVSPTPPSKLSKTRGQAGSRISKNVSKSLKAAVEKAAYSQNNRKAKRASTSFNNNSEIENIDVYPEIHLEEGSAAMNDEEANLLRSLASTEEVNVNDINMTDDPSVILKENGNQENNDSNMALACTSGSSGEREKTSGNIREELDMHIDTMQSEIDLLKEMLMKGNVSTSGLGGSPGNEGDILSAVGGLEGYCLDASALLGVCPASLGHLLDQAVIEGGGHVLNKLFSSEDPLPIGINSLPGSSEESSYNTKENPDFSVSGNEIAAYNPTLLDLVEDDDDSQLLNWYDETTSMPKETLSGDPSVLTSSSGSRGKGSVSGNVVGITGKGTGKVNVTSVNSPKNTNPSRRKTK